MQQPINGTVLRKEGILSVVSNNNSKEMSIFFRCPLRENREPGASPGRTRHCKVEAARIPLVQTEGVFADETEPGDLPEGLMRVKEKPRW